jgi:hypothetical protein
MPETPMRAVSVLAVSQKATVVRRLVLLSSASQREDGVVELPPNLKGGPAQKVVGKLLSEGVTEEVPARPGLPVWRRDDGNRAVGLHITKRGLAAIQVDQEGTQQPTQDSKPEAKPDEPVRGHVGLELANVGLIECRPNPLVCQNIRVPETF